MAEEQRFKSLNIYDKKKKEIILPGVYLAGVNHRHKIEQIEENKYKVYEYDNNNTEYIYDENIDYDGDIDKE